MKKLLFYISFLAFCAIPLAAFSAPETARKPVVSATFSGIISPVSAEYLQQMVDKAEEANAAALVINLDTPGGLDLSMREIIKKIMASKVPVVLYVSPAGARAASAGVFIAMASDVVAMAPGTNIGAAHPVMIGGSAPESSSPIPGLGGKDEKKDGSKKTMKGQEKAGSTPMEEKVVNDATAYIKALAQERGRNAEWAASAVTSSKSIPAEEAVKLKVADLIASDLSDLLEKLDGRVIPKKGVLKTKGAPIVNYQPTARQKFLAAVTDPNVAMILMSVGAAGIFIELYNPGLILPGIVGALSLILAFYAFQTLSANLAGLLLMLLGLVLFIAEVKVMSYGLLTVGGVIAVILGALMLFKTSAVMGVSVSMSVLASSVGGLLLVTLFILWIVIRAQTRKVVTGSEAMVGARGTAKTALSPAGTVFIEGELWDAISLEGNMEQGSAVLVDKLDGFVLKVRRG